MKKLYLLMILVVAACSGRSYEEVPYNEVDFARGGPDAPIYNERVSGFMQPANEYSNIDTARVKTEQEKNESAARWSTARKETRWNEYKGTMVRVEILLGTTELREMRLRLMQNANGMDIDGDARDVIARVADFEMKKVCGRNADSYVIVYDSPSFEVMRPTPYFDYRIESEGAVMREYGFRCIYNR